MKTVKKRKDVDRKVQNKRYILVKVTEKKKEKDRKEHSKKNNKCEESEKKTLVKILKTEG